MSIGRAVYDDLGAGLRQVRRHPGASAVVTLALAVCIGANSAVFSVVNATLLDPYGYPHSDRVVNVGMVWAKGPFGAHVQEISPRGYLDIAEAATSFGALGFVDPSAKADVHVGHRTRRVPMGRVTAGIWDVAGVPPRLGRVFTTKDGEGEEGVVVLSYELWVSTFAAQPSVLGRKLRIDDRSFEILGVMPPGFRLVDNASQLWIPKTFSDRERSEQSRGAYAFQALGRLREGVSVQQASNELSALHAGYLDRHPEAREAAERVGETYGVAGLGEWVGYRSSRAMLLTVQGAALLILSIGCLNVAGFLLIRGRRRSAELALRQAVGATRGRMATQLLIETLTLYALGAFAGLLLARAGVALLPRFLDSGEWLRFGRPLALDRTVVAFTLVTSLVVGLIAGCLPALAATRSSSSSDALRSASRVGRRTPRRRWAQGAHVAAQLAVCTVLLVGAAATLGNLRGLLNRGFGVVTADRLVARVALPAYRYGQPRYTPGLGDVDEGSRASAFKERALRGIRALPGVEGATHATRVPLSREHLKMGFEVRGYTPQPGEFVIAIPYGVGPDYFSVMGTPLLAGRALTEGDSARSQPVVVIGESVARRYLPGREAIGATISFFGRDWTVVGVAADALNIPMSMTNTPALYFPQTQWSGRLIGDEVSFVVYTKSPAQVSRAVRSALLAADPELDVQIDSMQALQRKALVTRRVPAGVTTFFAAIAVLLTALGVYGLLAHSVAERTNEIGVRIALGASRASIVQLVLAWAGWLSATGVAVGLVGAFYFCRLFASSLTEVNATAPGLFLAATGMVLGTALLAAYVPARHAARLDPIAALRAE